MNLNFDEWAARNDEDWKLVCGAGEAQPTDEDLGRLYTLLQAQKDDPKFEVAFLVLMTRYGSRLLPGTIAEG